MKSTQIEGTQISQDEMYYLKYMEETDDNKEIQNLKKTVEYAYKKIDDGKDIDFELVNTMHMLLLDSVRGSKKEARSYSITRIIYLSETGVFNAYHFLHEKNVQRIIRKFI